MSFCCFMNRTEKRNCKWNENDDRVFHISNGSNWHFQIKTLTSNYYLWQRKALLLMISNFCLLWVNVLIWLLQSVEIESLSIDKILSQLKWMIICRHTFFLTLISLQDYRINKNCLRRSSVVSFGAKMIHSLWHFSTKKKQIKFSTFAIFVWHICDSHSARDYVSTLHTLVKLFPLNSCDFFLFQHHCRTKASLINMWTRKFTWISICSSSAKSYNCHDINEIYASDNHKKKREGWR